MEKLLTRKEAAEYLGISLTQLDEARKQKRIAYVQYVPNGSVYFTAQALEGTWRGPRTGRGRWNPTGRPIENSGTDGKKLSE